MAVYESLLLNTAVPQIQAAQAGDSYVMVVNATTPALRITQTGTGNALEVEDSSNPDATPFVVSAAGDVGIGTSSPSYKLDVQASTAVTQTKSTTGTNAAYYVANNTGGDFYIGRENSAGTTFGATAYSSVLWAAGAYPMSFFTNGTERARITSTGEFQWKPNGSIQAMTLDASGNLGIGTTSPLSVAGYTFVDLLGSTGAQYRVRTSTVDLRIGASATDAFVSSTNSALWFGTNNTERARITSGGEVLFGLNAQTNTPANGFVFQNLGTTSSQVLIGHSNGSGSGTYYEAYFYDSTVIGSVTQNGTTGVLYNITSDYRLKTVTGPVTDAGSRIDALEPVEYTWKANGASARGFLAHKFQEVYPNSVTGQKDAVDAEGNPVYQNMQASTSEVIADLVAELQSLRARVAQLEAK
jgi:hypothetical protein